MNKISRIRRREASVSEEEAACEGTAVRGVLRCCLASKFRYDEASLNSLLRQFDMVRHFAGSLRTAEVRCTWNIAGKALVATVS